MPKVKTKKPEEIEDVDTASQTSASPAKASIETSDMLSEVIDENINLSLILKELREFRRDNGIQLTKINEDIIGTNKRIEEAEERIQTAETRIQTAEEVMTGLLKHQIELEARIIGLESQSRRDNVRIYGIPEESEQNAQSMATYVEQLLRENLAIPHTVQLRVERAHRSLVPRPPPEAAPRSIVVKLGSYRMKEEVLRLAWQKKGFQLNGKNVNLDHDYAPEVLAKRKQYAEAKAVLKQNKIRFQTPFPARLRVFYEDGAKLYGSAEEATRDMAQRGFNINILNPDHPSSLTLLEEVQRLTWRKAKRSGPRAATTQGHNTPSYQQKLQVFRREDRA